MHFSSLRNFRHSRMTLNGRHMYWARSRPTIAPRAYSDFRIMSLTNPDDSPASFSESGAAGASGIIPRASSSSVAEGRAMMYSSQGPGVGSQGSGVRGQGSGVRVLVFPDS